jgi:hypothetical protein
VEALVIPHGRCFAFSRKGKLKFTQAEAGTALKQAKASRARRGSKHTEERVYECPGCGFWHLTSRTQFEERGKV